MDSEATLTSVRPQRKVPLLHNGDRLTAEEFERRYDAMLDVKKAELINGVVFMPSPVRHEDHGRQHAAILGWLFVYWARTPGVQASYNATLRLALANRPQPDALLFIEPERGGNIRMAGGYIVGGPELVAEVSGSTASLDLNDKLDVYLANGVREYVVWRVEDDAIDWFVLRQGRFVPLTPAAGGVLQSEVFPGLWLDPQAMLGFHLGHVLALGQQGLASPEHAAFVAKLASGSV